MIYIKTCGDINLKTKNMKIIHTILAVMLLIISANCSSNDSEKTEIRFVDLQGNPRPIKTRVPEANAKIMSGQSTHEQMSKNIEREYNLNQRNIAESSKNQGKYAYANDSYSYNNSSVPKFTDEDVYRKNAPRIVVDNNPPSQPENPVIEYDLKEDNYARNKVVNRKSKNDIFEDTSSDDFSNTKEVSKPNKVLAESGSSKDIFTNKSGLTSGSTVTSRTKKIITYSSNDVNKNEALPNQTQSVDDNLSISESSTSSSSSSSTEESSEYEDNSSSGGIEIIDETNSKLYAKYGKMGKFYVQVGAYFNSKSAKDKIKTIRGFGKGKVFIGYKNNSRIYRSVYGPFKTRAQADNFKNRVKSSGNDAIVIRGK